MTPDDQGPRGCFRVMGSATRAWAVPLQIWTVMGMSSCTGGATPGHPPARRAESHRAEARGTEARGTGAREAGASRAEPRRADARAAVARPAKRQRPGSTSGSRIPRSGQPPRLPFHRERLCRRDSDCVIRPTPCPGCSPCKPTWRPVCNRKTARRIRAARKRTRCPPPRPCRRCAHPRNWLGSRPVCFRRQCTLAPLQNRPGAPSKGLACKRDADCGFFPRSSCLCRPCGLYWRQVANQEAIRREIRRRSVMGQCIRPTCKPCPARRALGTRAVCVKGRCTAR
jgi:hypothetical protein